MILADSSIWVDHLRAKGSDLSALLDHGQIAMHPFVMGELALGHIKNRDEILLDLGRLQMVTVATNPEVLGFIKRRKLAGCGIGYVDAHLLTAAALNSSVRLWTRDKNLKLAADSLALAYKFH